MHHVDLGVGEQLLDRRDGALGTEARRGRSRDVEVGGGDAHDASSARAHGPGMDPAHEPGAEDPGAVPGGGQPELVGAAGGKVLRAVEALAWSLREGRLRLQHRGTHVLRDVVGSHG